MSTEIEQRVVEMQFDNKQFERNVSTTMSSLDKLKQSLNLTGAAKGLERVGSAAKGITLTGLSSAAETVSLKFNAMYSAVDQVFRNLVSRAQFAGERIISALTVDPIKTGFAEYETQINAVQTILANTSSKGKDIDDVNRALDELNTYADKTIYNFTEMTRNIGTFTAAGVDLDKSVTSIKGIANLAAVSGSSSQQASTAMYQLSQALAAGKVSLMDWNSVVNAGMGGEVFQEALKRTSNQRAALGKQLRNMSEAQRKAYAESHGYTVAEVEAMKEYRTSADEMIKKYGTFRESLTQGEWLTADVLTETLTQLSGAYTEADLIAQGYTKSQAKEIMSLAETAVNAATKVKTFSQLWDTLKESAQSGWTQTWEIIVGDFEEAKELLTNVSDVIGGMIGESANARNELLQGWKDAGGRDELIVGLKNIFEGLMNVVKPIKEAFREIFPRTTVDQLLKFTRGFRELTEKFIFWKQALPPLKGQMEEFGRTEAEIIEHNNRLKSTIDKITRIFKGLFAIVDIGIDAIMALGRGFFELLGMTAPAGEGLLSILASVGDWAVGVRDAAKETDFFNKTVDGIVGFVKGSIRQIKIFGHTVKTEFQAFKDKFQFPDIEGMIGGAIDKLKSFGSAVKSAFQSPGAEGFFQILHGIWNMIVQIGSRVGEILMPLGEAFGNLFTGGNLANIFNDGIFAAVLVGVYNFVKNLDGPLESINDMFEGLSGEGGVIDGIKETLDSVRGCFEAYQNQLNAEIIKKIAIAIAILAAAIFVISSIDSDKLDSSMGAITVLFVELIGALAVFSKMDFGGNGLVKGVTAINGLAAALFILSVAMKIMSTMSWSDLAVGIVGTVAGLGALVAAVNLLPEKKVTKSAKAIGKLSTALVILAAGMKIMASMSWSELGVALTGTVVGLGALVAAVNLLPKDAGARTLGMIGLVTAMVILGGALKIMGSMNWDEIGKGLAAMGGALTEIVIAMNLMPKDMALRSLGMVGLATAMVILGGALKIMGTMSWEEIGRGLAVLGGALIELAIALKLMNGSIAGAGALIIAAGALAILTPVLKTLGGMSWEEIGKGLVALAGAFAVIGVAGLLLTPLVPTLLALAGAMAAFGGATLALGVGIAAISWGFATLATAGAAGATALVAALGAIILGILGLIPSIIQVVGAMVVALCDVVIEAAPKLAETILVVVAEILAALATYTPQIIDSLMQFLIGLLDGLAAHMPQLIASAVNLIGAFFEGVFDAFSGIDTTSLLQAIAGAGLLAGLIFALSAITPMIPGAMAGVLGMGVIIAEMAAVLAAVGLLAQIPGLSWLIGEGGDLLQQIGTAIGQFVGGIVGGFAEGATSTLPDVGTNLSNFMTNLQPFIEGMSNIDDAMLDNTTKLVAAILALTAADLISGITSFFTGGQSLGDFAKEIVTFGTAMKDYAAEVAGVDTAVVSASVSAASKLVKMAGDIPSDGLFGTDGIDDFGKNIVSFGKSMKKYGAEVAGIDAEAISASVSAAKGLVQVANQLPDDGTFGTDGIDNFGDNIVSFAKSMKKYSDKIAEVSIGAITKSVSAVRTLITVINSMAGMDSSGVASFKQALNDLSKANFNGFVNAFTASTDKLTNIGKNMFNSIIAGVESTKTKFVNTANSMLDAAATALIHNSARFKAAGIAVMDEFVKGILARKPRVAGTFNSAADSAIAAIRGYYGDFESAGAYLVAGFASGISVNKYKAAAQAKAMAAAAANAARKELDEHSPSRVGYGIGDFFGVAFVNAIADNVRNAYDASANLANAAESGLKGAFDKVLGIISGEIDIQPTITPVIDLTDVRSGVNSINGMLGLSPSVGVLANVNAVNSMMNQRNQNGGVDEIVYAIGKLQKALGNVGGTTNIINGITYDDGSNINKAIEIIAREILIGGRA